MSTRIYEVEFADGKRATALDMEGRPAEEAMAGIRANFQRGYVARIRPKADACRRGKNPTDCSPK